MSRACRAWRSTRPTSTTTTSARSSPSPLTTTRTTTRCLDALERVKNSLAGYDLYVSTDLGNTQEETIDHEISVIMVYVAIVIVAVLLFTSETYGEVPVLILTFVVALVLNQGTNFMLGKISFISNSVTSILQLALSIDYAIIFCNRFKEEHRSLPLREAVIVALSKSIPEIGASSLTTIGGLVAMLFMQFKLGPDMAHLPHQIHSSSRCCRRSLSCRAC